MNPDDERSKMIFTFLDAVEKIQPEAFVMENVKALECFDKWADVRRQYLNRVQKLGYNCVPIVLNARDFGVSQKRERVFFIGFRNNKDPFLEYHLKDLLEEQKSRPPVIRELLKSLGPAGTEKNPNRHYWCRRDRRCTYQGLSAVSGSVRGVRGVRPFPGKSRTAHSGKRADRRKSL